MARGRNLQAQKNRPGFHAFWSYFGALSGRVYPAGAPEVNTVTGTLEKVAVGLKKKKKRGQRKS